MSSYPIETNARICQISAENSSPGSFWRPYHHAGKNGEPGCRETLTFGGKFCIWNKEIHREMLGNFRNLWWKFWLGSREKVIFFRPCIITVLDLNAHFWNGAKFCFMHDVSLFRQGIKTFFAVWEQKPTCKDFLRDSTILVACRQAPDGWDL